MSKRYENASEIETERRAKHQTTAFEVQSKFTSNAETSASVQPPKPEEKLDAYSHQRLEQGLEYIISASKRDITPRTRTFLKLHQEAYEKALADPFKNLAAVAVVQTLDRVYYTEAFYFKPRQGKDYEQLLAFVKLRQLELLANYGDASGIERGCENRKEGRQRSRPRPRTRDNMGPNRRRAVRQRLAGDRCSCPGYMRGARDRGRSHDLADQGMGRDMQELSQLRS
jgi:hypothetical protein